MKAVALLAAAFVLAAAHADPRRSSSLDMSPALQTMQRDDTQNPAMLWVAEGQELWTKPPASGHACSSCHSQEAMRGVALRYPAFDASNGKVLTLAGRVDQCRQRHQQRGEQGPDGAEVLALSAWLAQRSLGLPIAPSGDPRLAPWRDRGAALWSQRFGQLNLSCALCHDQHAGARLGGAPIPQAHPTAYPVYRLEWQELGSLQRRLRGCLVGVRAEPFAPDADEWVALEVFLMQRAAGMASEGAGLRP